MHLLGTLYSILAKPLWAVSVSYSANAWDVLDMCLSCHERDSLEGPYGLTSVCPFTERLSCEIRI